ncbi:MAG TPA: extracellular solute-binding protein, partial [Nocardioidaceae bacterium]|nr:extracellular solute-binding protein [Nocardioidaceae bacterium]
MRPPTRLATALLASGLMLSVAACAPGQGGGEETEGDGTLDPARFKGKTLDYVYFTDGPDEQATRALVNKFEAETGARVNLQIVPFDTLEQTLQARVNGGDAPEVARVADWRPFADVLADFKPYFGENYDEKFIDGMAQAAQDSDGNMPAVPSDLTMNGPLINVDAFKAADVPTPSVDDPWTWNEMVAAATKVQQANGMQFALAIDKSGHRVSTVLSQFGTTMFDAEGNVALDQAKAEEAIGTLNDLMQRGLMSKDLWLEAGARYEDANELFLAREVPVYISGNWQVGLLSEDAPFEWAAVPNPCAERCGGFPGGKYMVAFTESDEPELGVYFVDWMNRPDNQQALDEQAFWLPTRTELVEAGISYPARG